MPYHGRSLTASQRAQVFAGLTNYRQGLEDEARKRQGHGQTAPGKSLVATIATSDEKSRDVLAKTAKVSPRTMQTAKQSVCRFTVSLS